MTADDRYGRRISDPGALRALAHAGRYAILERLQSDGPATATACAQTVGLSPSACSYHLRILARNGLVEPDADATTDGRERVWRATSAGWTTEVDPDDPGTAWALTSTLTRVMLADSDAKVLAFTDRVGTMATWRDAALISNSTIVVTPAELAQVAAALLQVLQPYFSSGRAAADVPDGARPVHVALRTAPRLD